MRIVLATYSLYAIGGSETYAVTVADQLQRLGHDVWLFSVHHGAASELAAALGIRLATSPPADADVLVVQDRVVAHLLAATHPRAPQVFVAHSDVQDLQLPPQLPGQTAAVVALYDRVERRIRALALEPEVVRLRQPVDIERFLPLRPLPERPRVALAFGNYLHGERLALLGRACERAGLELRHLGTQASPRQPGGVAAARARRLAWILGARLGGERLAALARAAPAIEGRLRRLGLALPDPPPDAPLTLNGADVVFGKARVIHEAMACGRAAYVYDHNGADGWVTAASYERLVADNFGGQTDPAPIDEDRLVADLAGYDRGMGLVNRDLAVTHHAASKHAAALVEVLRRAAPPASPAAAAPHDELARAFRLLHKAEDRGFGLLAETRRLGHRVLELEDALEVAWRTRPGSGGPGRGPGGAA